MPHSTRSTGRHSTRPASSESAARRLGLTYGLVAVCAISIASVLVRWAAPITSVEISFWRLTIASVAVLAAAVAIGRTPRYRRADWPALLVMGLVTAVHFLSYIAALSFTTVAHTLAIIYTAPLFVAALGAWRLRERPGRAQLAGIVLAVAGITILTGLEPTMSTAMALGDGLAFVSAVTLAIYSVGGRLLRGRHSLLAYAGTVYGLAALWQLPFVIAVFDPSRYSWTNTLAVVGLGLIPLGLGHTLYNAALRLIPAVTVNTIATQEVAVGVLLAWLLLAEAPTPVALVGGVVTLVGIVVVLRAGPNA